MSGLRRFFLRGRLEQDVSDEIRAHLDEKTEELIRSGVPQDEAAARARRAFGNVGLIEERARDVWRWAWLEDFLIELRFAGRQLRRAPGFALAAALILALGIGANTAVFSVVHAVILRPLPFADAGRLVSVTPGNRHGPGGGFNVSYPNFFDFRSENRVFSHLVSYRATQLSLTGPAEPLQLAGEIVGWDLFQALGVRPILGRGFVAHDEDPGVRVVVLAYSLWATALGGDRGVVGRTITLDGEPYVVVGVAPQGFNFPVTGEPVQFWTPLAEDARTGDSTHALTAQRGARMLSVIGRLRAGVSRGAAEAQMMTIGAALAARYPDDNQRYPRVYVGPLLEEWVGSSRQALLFLLGAVGLLLLLACANIANLLLSRTAEREREFALRAAIGAGRSRMVRQVLAESALLALVGVVGGIVTAWLVLRVTIPLAGTSTPRIAEAGIDRSVLLFSLAVTAATALLSSLAPVARLARRQLGDSLKDGGRANAPASDRLRGALVVAQVALGLTLVSAAGLLTASYAHVARRDPGFRPERLLAFSVNPPAAKYSTARRQAFYDELLQRLRALPGASSAALANPVPLTGIQMTVGFDIEGQPTTPGARPTANLSIVSPEFFRTAGVPLVRGRGFSDADGADSPPVVVVNRAFADRFFPGQNALGRRIQSGAVSGSQGERWEEIVGVVGNARQAPLGTEDDPIYYFAYRQLPWCCGAVIVRASGSPAALSSGIRAVVAAIDPDLPVFDVATVDSLLSSGIAAPRLLMLLLAGFAGLGLLLTAVGLYGVMSYGVVQRTREIGVRMALGASRTSVLGLVLRQATTLVGTGLLLGSAGALLGARVMRTVLFGLGPWQPALLLAAASTVVGAALLATYLPARRAASVDPASALRTE